MWHFSAAMAVYSVREVGRPAKSAIWALDVRTLIAFGALPLGGDFDGSQWWRLVTATLLHGSMIHLALNGFALFQLGRWIESWYGAGLLAAHLTFGTTGCIASLAFHYDPTGKLRTLTVGASAPFGLMSLLTFLAWNVRRTEGLRVFLNVAEMLALNLLASWQLESQLDSNRSLSPRGRRRRERWPAGSSAGFEASLFPAPWFGSSESSPLRW